MRIGTKKSISNRLQHTGTFHMQIHCDIFQLCVAANQRYLGVIWLSASSEDAVKVLLWFTVVNFSLEFRDWQYLPTHSSPCCVVVLCCRYCGLVSICQYGSGVTCASLFHYLGINCHLVLLCCKERIVVSPQLIGICSPCRSSLEGLRNERMKLHSDLLKEEVIDLTGRFNIHAQAERNRKQKQQDNGV